MNTALTGTHGKLAEARFFLALLSRLQDGKPITTESLDDEATYFVSALLNACYSVWQLLLSEGTEALKETNRSNLKHKLKEEVDNLRDQNRDLYFSERGSDKYGLRSLVVHHKPVDVGHRDRTLGTLGSVPFGRLMPGEIRRYRSLYVDDPFSERHISITPRMTTHLHELESLVTQWRELIG